MKIAVSILSEINDYKNAVDKVNKSSADFLHLDIMDNTFTKTTSFNIEEVKEICDLSKKKVDIHIMSSNLDNIIDDYINLKPYSISIHYEAVCNIEKYINKIKENNIKAYLAVNPKTLISDIHEYLDIVDGILVMSVEPGKGGQIFINDVVSKVKKLKELQSNYSYVIQIDGGINNETIKLVDNYIDIAVSGSYITTTMDYNEQIRKLTIRKSV